VNEVQSNPRLGCFPTISFIIFVNDIAIIRSKFVFGGGVGGGGGGEGGNGAD